MLHDISADIMPTSSVTSEGLYRNIDYFIQWRRKWGGSRGYSPPCWIVIESFHKRETCFAGKIFRAWSGGPSLAEPPRGIEKAWLREDTTADLAFGRRMRLELCCIVSIILLILKSYDFRFKTSNCLTFL